MIKSNHVSEIELLEMINGDGDSDKFRTIGQHLHECEDCRKALDELTAQSVIWKKAPALLKDKSLTPSPDAGTIDFPRWGSLPVQHANESVESNDPEWKYPIDELVDPPRHPEMMGRIGKYDIECEVGRGGMGVVLKAHDAELNRPLAIKILAPHLASHGTARKRFAQEAIAAAGVLHPNVIAVHGVSNEGKTPYIVMPYVAGPSLQTLVDQNGPLTEIEITRITLQIASGLAAAHSQGLVHRDIKPANILVEAEVNRVLITDFGLARAEDDASLTRTGWLTGTPNYMSPEQTRGDRPDQRSDLFSLGSLMYFLATGRLPFRAETPLGVLNRIQNDDPTPIRQVNNQVSRTLSDVIEKLLRKQPGQRFQSSAALHEFLEKHLAFLHQPDVSKPPKVNVKERSQISGKTKRNLAIGAIAVPLLAGAIALSGVFGEPGGEAKKPTINYNNLAELNGEVSDQPGEETAANKQKGSRLFAKANELWKDGKTDEALSMFERASAYPEVAADSFYNMGCIYAIEGQTDKAFDALNSSVESGFCDAQHFQKDNDVSSLQDDKRFEKIVERMATRQQANELVQRAINSAQDDDFEEAESLCRQALEIDPGNEKVFVNLAYAIHMQGRLDEALPWHEKSAQSQRFAALGNYNLCCVSSLKNEKDKAFKYFDKAIESGLAENLNADYLAEDSDLDNIRTDDRFKVALKKFKASEPRHRYFNGMRHNFGHGSMLLSTGEKDFTPELLHNADEVKGTWEGEFKGDRIQLGIMRHSEGTDWKWGFSTDYDRDEFEPKVTEATTSFKLERKCGTIAFEGSLEDGIGEGTFVFTGSESYRNKLSRKGIKDAPDALLFRMFVAWKDEDKIIENLQELQTLGLDKNTLQVLMIDGVRSDQVTEYQAADLVVADQLIFLIWRVPADLLVDYKAAGLNLEEHKGYINQRVPAELLISYNKAGFDLEEYGKFITWRVKPDLLMEYQNADLEPLEHKDFVNQRVPPTLLKSYTKAGFELKKNRKFIKWRVEPSLLKSYEDADLSRKKYSRYINMRVPASLLKSYSDSGLDLKKNEVFINNRVEAELVKRYVDAGLDPCEYKKSILQRKDPKNAANDD